jgi:hypothetical protein
LPETTRSNLEKSAVQRNVIVKMVLDRSMSRVRCPCVDSWSWYSHDASRCRQAAHLRQCSSSMHDKYLDEWHVDCGNVTCCFRSIMDRCAVRRTRVQAAMCVHERQYLPSRDLIVDRIADRRVLSHAHTHTHSLTHSLTQAR